MPVDLLEPATSAPAPFKPVHVNLDLPEPDPAPITFKQPTLTPAPKVDLLAPKASTPAASPAPVNSALPSPNQGVSPVSVPITPRAAAPLNSPPAPVDLLAPKAPPTPEWNHAVYGNGPTLADIRQKRSDEAAAIPATVPPNMPDDMHRSLADDRKFGLLPPEPAKYFKVSGQDFESIVHSDRGARGTPVGEAYQSGRVLKDQEGNYIVTEGLANAIAAEKAGTPEPQQSVGQDLKNVPANVGAAESRGVGGLAGILGTAAQYPRHVLHEMGRMFPNANPETTQTNVGVPSKPIDVQAGQFLQRQGDYLTEGAAKTEKDLPVQGEIGKAAVGVGTLGVDAAMGALTGGAGFVASFAGRSAGTMYAQARAQGDDPQTAAAKGITAGFAAAITPQIAHILPPEVGQDIAFQAARAYMGTGGMVAAQAVADELTLKAGTTQRIDLSHVFPEAATQGLIGVAFHGGGHLMGKGEPAAPQPAQPEVAAPPPPGARPIGARTADNLQLRPTDQLNPLDRVQQPQGEPVPRGQRQAQTPQGEAARGQVKDLLAPKPAEAPPLPEGATPITKEAPDAEQPPVVQPAAETAANAQAAPETVGRAVEAPRAGGEAGGVGGKVNRKPLYEMSPDELDRQEQLSRTYEKGILDRIFGPDAKKYAALERTSNRGDGPASTSAYNEMVKMEDALSPEARDELFGNGPNTLPNSADIREMHRAITSLDDTSETTLGRSLAKAITDIGDAEDPTTMNDTQQRAYAMMRHANEIIGEKGWDSGKVIESAIRSAAKRFSDPEDAAFMLRRWIKEGREPAPQPQEPPKANRTLPAAPQPSAPQSTARAENVEQGAGEEGGNAPRTQTGGEQGRELPNVGGQYAFPGTEAAVHEAMGREEFEGKIRRENPRLNPAELPGIRRHLETFAAERAKEGADMYDLTKELSGNFDLEKGGDYWVPTDLAQRLAGRAVAQATARGERKPQQKYERRAEYGKGEDARSDVRTILHNAQEDRKAAEPPVEPPKKPAEAKKLAAPTGDPAALKAELDALQKRYAAVHEEMAALRKKKSPRLDARSMRTEADVKIDALNKESWDINTQAKEKRELLNRLNMAELVKTGDPVQRIAAQAEYEGRKVTTEEWEKMKALAREEAVRQGVDTDSIESAALDAAGMISTHPSFNTLKDQIKAFKVQNDAHLAKEAERKKQDAEREKAAEEADKKGRVERAGELKDGAPETTTRFIDRIQSAEGARFLSDGRWAIDTKAIDPANKTFKKLNAKKRTESRFVNDKRGEEILKNATEGAKGKPPLEDLGYRTVGEEVGRGAKKKTEYKHFRYYADAEGQVHAVNAEYMEILKDATGFDSVRAQGRPSEPLVLYKGKKVVGMIMPINIDRGGIDVATARARKGGKAEVGGNRTDAFGGPIEKEAAAKPERKPITKNVVRDGIFGKDSFIGGDVVPLAKEGAKAVHEAVRQIQSTFAPQTRGEQAKLMQGIAREHGATLAQRSDRALEKLKDARKAFEGNKPEQNYDFIDKMENGEKQDNPQLTDAARRIREMLDGRRREVQALGKGKLEHFIQDYFPHIWEDPKAAAKTFAQILGKRPLEGSKGFLKKRTIDTFGEGIKAGLKPISDNPVDLVLLKIREMDRYILGQKMLAEMKPKGLAKYYPATEQLPEGVTELDDKIAQVYGPPTVKVEEHVDKAQHDALTQVMDNLGIRHERTTESLGRPAGGGKILGLATEGDKTVKTKFATGLGVLAHEVGHQLDYKYNLTDKLLTTIGEAENAGIHSPTRPPGRFIVRPQSEFDALSKLRFTNVEKTPSKKYRDYNGSTREQMAQVLEAYIHAPDRMREVAPRVFQAFSDFIRSRPELAPLVDARSSLSHTELTNEVAHGGLLKMGRYAAPDAAANVFNNYLSPGLRDKSGLFRAYLGAANVMNQAQLGLSAFHVGFTSMDAMTSKLALGIEQAVEGKPLDALKSLITTPTAPITNIIKGSKLLREWVTPGSEGEDIAKMVNGLRAAGGRAKQDNFYRTNMADKMIKAFKRGNILGGVMRLPAGVMDMVAKPVMEYIVPRQKLGVFADLAQKEMAKLGPDATHDDVRRVLGQAWDSVDNRMGQVVYDNLFWKKAVKDISMASVRSLGWNLGTFRELGGGAIDFAKAGAQALQFKKPEFTHRMAYTVAMPALAGLIGGTLHYLMTGKKPDDLKDYFFPKTGDTDANGHDVRLSLPSYMKDVYAYGHAPLDTLAHKLHPAIATTIEMLQNKDFYNTKIVNEDDPLMKRTIDRAKYVASQFVPFGVQGYQKLDEEGAPLSKKVLPFIGITQAPGSVSMTKAEKVAQDLMRERMPVGSRTQAEADRTKAKTDLVREMKAGKPGAADRAREMVRKGELDVEDLKSMLKRSKQSPLVAHIEHLDADDALRVWAVASEQERKEIRQQMIMKITRAQRMPQDQKNKARQAIMRGEDVKLPG